jgi:hypothetical protein
MFLVSFSGYAVFAADSNGETIEPSNVTITLVLPEHTDEPALPEGPEPAFIKVYPSDVTELREGGGWQIVKTYEFNAGENPEDIPRGSFERNGWRFSLTDIIRKETAHAETREHTETVTLNTDTKELEKILPQLAPTLEYAAEDGFVGILSLDVSSITMETAGTKTSSYTMSITREYPRLSSNDTSLVPKTVEDKGKTYTLAGVDWKSGNTVTVDYSELPEYFTAIATYTATGTSTRATGYITTAEYAGALAKLAQGKTQYTAYFIGEEIRTPLEMAMPAASDEPIPDAEATAEPTPTTTAEPTTVSIETHQSSGNTDSTGKTGARAWIAIIPIAVALAGGAAYFMKKRGSHNAKTDDTDSVVSGDDNGSGSPGDGV